MRRTLISLAAFAALLSACAPTPKPDTRPIEPKAEAPDAPFAPAQLRPWSFARLDGWAQDRHGEALVAFQKSCASMLRRPVEKRVAANDTAPGGQVKNWLGACRAAMDLDPSDDAGAKLYFETWFVPYEVRDGAGAEAGLFTGYYEPELNGAWTQGGDFQTPLLARPDDLISVSLGTFDQKLGGNTIWGRVMGAKLQPYPDRAAIEGGQLGNLAKPVLWVDDPVDAFFLHVQGSGRVRMADGSVARVGFAAKNGRPYQSIGRVLIDSGEIPADRLTMGSIRDWVNARPKAGPALLTRNPSYVFFRLLEGDGPLGAQGVALTAERSLAVDRRFLPLGAPMWLQTHDALDKSTAYNRLMVSQDTGGAIKGHVRGDIFFGAGDLAIRRAGNMKRPGRYFILLPHSVMPTQ
ncbi:murein transglycosylase A [Pseudomonadota bacterium]